MPQFSDEAILISTKLSGENHLIVKLLCKENGIKSSVYYGGNSQKNTATSQIGNELSINWKAKTQQSMGYVNCELVNSYAVSLYENSNTLNCLYAVLKIVDDVFIHDEPNIDLFLAVKETLQSLTIGEYWAIILAKFEINLLSKIGYGLSLNECVVTGQKDDLIYISPKSGCAVSREAGEEYKDKLLPFPTCFNNEAKHYEKTDFINALRVSGYFIEKYIYSIVNKELPSFRKQIYNSLLT